jgi:hypothetical protein
MRRIVAHRRAVAVGIVGVVLGISSVGTGVVQAASDITQDRPEAASTAQSPDRKVLIRQLVRQVLAISRQSPLKIERVLEVLGSRLGPEEHPTPYLTSWSLAPTPLIAGGTLTRMTDGIVFQLTPLPSLELAFQDFEKELLDLPYYLSAQPGHMGEDAIVVVRTVYHMFRVKAGELLFEVPSAISDNDPHQIATALYRAFDTVEAKNRTRLPVREIRITSAVRPRWKGAPSMRELRRKK